MGSRAAVIASPLISRHLQVDSSPTPATARDAFRGPAEVRDSARRRVGVDGDSRGWSTRTRDARLERAAGLGGRGRFVGRRTDGRPRSCGLAFIRGTADRVYRIRWSSPRERGGSRGAYGRVHRASVHAVPIGSMSRARTRSPWTGAAPIGGTASRAYTRSPRTPGIDFCLMSSVRWTRM